MKKAIRFINLLSGYQFYNCVPKFVLFVYATSTLMDTLVGKNFWYLTLTGSLCQDVLCKQGGHLFFRNDQLKTNALTIPVRICNRSNDSFARLFNDCILLD